MECSGEHRGFGVDVSFIKSVTLDQWTEPQVNLMKVGGNQRLKEFLTTYEMPDYLDRVDIYKSKIMAYYRRQLKCESRGELFMEPLPSKSTFWDKSSPDDNTFDNKAYSNTLFSGKSNINNSGYSSNPFNDNDRIDLTGNNNNHLYSNNSGNEKSTYPKSEIVIPDNHYQKGNEYSNIASNFSNSIPSEPKFAKIDSKYSNDPRFASIGSEPINNSSSSSTSYISTVGSYLGGFGSVLGKMWGAGVGAASMINDKLKEYSVGSNLMYVGSKTLEAVSYVGSKVIEKGGEVIQSETVHNLASKAGEGLGYIKNKIIGGSSSSQSNSSSVSSDNYSSGNYSSTSSDTYYNKY